MLNLDSTTGFILPVCDGNWCQIGWWCWWATVWLAWSQWSQRSMSHQQHRPGHLQLCCSLPTEEVHNNTEKAIVSIYHGISSETETKTIQVCQVPTCLDIIFLCCLHWGQQQYCTPCWPQQHGFIGKWSTVVWSNLPKLLLTTMRKDFELSWSFLELWLGQHFQVTEYKFRHFCVDHKPN